MIKILVNSKNSIRPFFRVMAALFVCYVGYAMLLVTRFFFVSIEYIDWQFSLFYLFFLIFDLPLCYFAFWLAKNGRFPDSIYQKLIDKE